MNHIRKGLLLTALFLAPASTALATTTWYVNGVSGSDSNNCMSPLTACKTIGHAISLAASGDSIKVAAATYKENLGIVKSLNLIGSGSSITIIDGGGVNVVISVNAGIRVVLSNVTVRNGFNAYGAGIDNNGQLTLNASTVTGNHAFAKTARANSYGGGIFNSGTMTINKSTLSGNSAACGTFGCAGMGGGIYNGGHLLINNSTLSGNAAYAHFAASQGGGVYGGATISNSTLSGNSATRGGGIFGGATLQNSIVANSGGGGGNCYGGVHSNGYNLSSDSTCDFSGPGDLNNTDPKLGTLGYHGGPTQTIPLPSGSPAIDAGNPGGCTDGQGHLLTTDQRGQPRPDKEDTGGCDMGAYESQSD